MELSREMQNVMGIVYGKPPRVWPWTTITRYRADGCMAEQMTPLYVGKAAGKATVTVHTYEGKVQKPAVAIRVTESYSSDYPRGRVVKELKSELRRMSDGSVAVIR